MRNKHIIFTIGHSTLKFDKFISTLKFFNIEKLIDVRSHPGSRFVPQYNKEFLSVEVLKHNIKYEHFTELGGRRKETINDSFVNGWKNSSFKNYAAYTLTEEYETGIARLMREAKKSTVCFMCAESVPWKCHRLLISNTLINYGLLVYHILSENKCENHTLNKYGAKTALLNGKIIYPKS